MQDAPASNNDFAKPLVGFGVPGDGPAIEPRELAQPAAYTNGFCITLYNEPWSQLRSTLESVLLSLDEAATTRTTNGFICIVADGRDRLSADVLEALERSHCLAMHPHLDAMGEVHVSQHEARILLARWGSMVPSAGERTRITLITCIKSANRGKLDSHEVFFERICAQYVPEFCYQLDAGTVLTARAIRTLTERLRQDPCIAAITPCLTPPVPPARSSLLHSWQYHDFALRQSVLLPVEGLLDFLGVMPGQVSAFRWRALRPSLESKHADPLWAYLHGIAAHSPLRRLMYLSEDRIIGSALVLDEQGRWKLKYEPAAVAFTDYCETLPELLRQRRRWTNSAMVCRLWLARHWGRILRNANRSPGEKFRQSLALVLQLTVGIREFIAPAHLLALVFVLAQMAASTSMLNRSLVVAMVLLSLADVVISWKTASAANGGGKFLRRLLAPVGWASAGLFVASMALCLPAGALAIALVPSVIVFVCLAVVLPARALPTLARTHFAPLQYSLLSNSILGYSLLHMHDSTWGTKGLIARSRADLADKHLRRFRIKVLATWVAINGLVLAVASFPGFLSPHLNPVIECICLLDLLVAGVALAWLGARRLLNRRAAGTARCHPEDPHADHGDLPPGIARLSRLKPENKQ